MLQERGDEPVAESGVNDLPPAVLRRELTAALQARGASADERVADRVIVETALSRAVAIAVLSEIGHQEELAQEVESAYRARQRMMFVDPGTIAAAALLVLVLKLRRVRIGGGRADASSAMGLLLICDARLGRRYGVHPCQRKARLTKPHRIAAVRRA